MSFMGQNGNLGLKKPMPKDGKMAAGNDITMRQTGGIFYQLTLEHNNQLMYKNINQKGSPPRFCHPYTT